MKAISSVNKIYLFTLGCCVLIWLYLSFIAGAELGSPGQSCYFKSLFGFPCAACGSNHAIQALTAGRWITAFQYNPLAFLIIWFNVLVSLSLIYDLLFKKSIWLNISSGSQRLLRNKMFSYTLAAILLIHWYFNVIKYMKG